MFLGASEDSTMNFYLLIAELQRLNESISTQLRLSEKNLHHTNLEIERKIFFNRHLHSIEFNIGIEACSFLWVIL